MIGRFSGGLEIIQGLHRAEIVRYLRGCENCTTMRGGRRKESNETDADVGDTCIVPSMQIGIRY